MSMSVDTLELVTALFRLCKRSAAWYARCNTGVTDAAAKAQLRSIQLQRARFASALEAVLWRAGGEVDSASEMVALEEDGGDLAERCAAHEETVVAGYRAVIDRGLDAHLEPLVLSQFEQVIDGCESMRLAGIRYSERSDLRAA